jgi:hypothetical protein
MIGLIGEDSFWYGAGSCYKSAADLRYNLQWISNSSQYWGPFAVKSIWNPYDGADVVDVENQSDPSTWVMDNTIDSYFGGCNDGTNYYGGCEEHIGSMNTPYSFKHYHAYYTNGSAPSGRTSVNFHLGEHYYQDHMGILVWIPLVYSGDIAFRSWPSDVTCNSPDYSTPP